MSVAAKATFSPNLDLLRAVAVLCVFVSHLIRALGNKTWGSLGRFGIILFFVHTSFVLMGSLERLQPLASSDWQLATAFWIRRIFRLYPLAILFVVLIALFHVPPSLDQPYVWIGTKAFLSNLALVQNITYSPDISGVLWSLPVELQMYVLLPALYLVVRGKRRYLSAALWLLSIVLAIALPALSERLSVFRYGPCFTSGVVAYDLIRSKQWRWSLPSWVWPLGIAAAIFLFGPHDNLNLGTKIERAWVISLFVAVLYANVREGSNGVFRPVLHWIAEHSYGIYLSHILVIDLALETITGIPLWTRVLILIVGAVSIPALLFISVEKPLTLAGSHVARRFLRRAAVQSSKRELTAAGDN